MRVGGGAAVDPMSVALAIAAAAVVAQNEAVALVIATHFAVVLVAALGIVFGWPVGPQPALTTAATITVLLAPGTAPWPLAVPAAASVYHLFCL